MTKKKPVRHKRTIAKELLDQWQRLERKGDQEKIATELKISKPTAVKALIYGCVHQQAIVDGINKYFADRLMAEKAEAEKLGRLQDTAA